MNDNKNTNTEQPYIVEKIVKPKTTNRQRYVINLLFVIFGAVLFGIIACFSFIFIYPYVDKRVHPADPTANATIALTRYTEPPEMSMEDPFSSTEESEATTSETMATAESGETTGETDLAGVSGELNEHAKDWIREQIKKATASLSPSLENLTNYAKEITKLYSTVEKSMVSIIAAENIDAWFGQPSAEYISGIVFANMPEKKRLYILTQYDVTALKDIRVRFSGNEKFYEAEISGYDSILGLCVLTVTMDVEDEKTFERISPIMLGNTYLVKQGSLVMAVGSPFALHGTMLYGSVVSIARDLTNYDTIYRMFYTNISAPVSGKGFLINMEGQLIGIINSEYRREELKDYISAIGTEEITDFLNHMANGISSGYCGIVGQTVTAAISERTGMPQGVYVKDVQNGSPAYAAGIMNGDIITAISTTSVTKFSQLIDALTNGHLPGETVILTVMRQGKSEYKEIEITVTLGVRK